MKNQKRKQWIVLFGKLNMFMENNLDKWNTIGAIRKSYDEFINNLKKIRDLQPQLEKDLSPVNKEMEDQRKTLEEKLIPVKNIFEVYCSDHHPGEKSTKLLISKKKLDSLSTGGILEYATKFNKHLVKLIIQPEEESSEFQEREHSLVNYGLTKALMDDLNTAIHQLQSALKLKKDVTSYRKKTLLKSDKLIKANKKILEDRLNKLMTVFSGTHPSFYRDYISLINIKNKP